MPAGKFVRLKGGREFSGGEKASARRAVLQSIPFGHGPLLKNPRGVPRGFLDESVVAATQLCGALFGLNRGISGRFSHIFLGSSTGTAKVPAAPLATSYLSKRIVTSPSMMAKS